MSTQNFIQNTAGTQTTAQVGTPTANNGNPNTAYNWTSYVPQVTQQQGGLPSVNFSLLSSQAPASSAGYTPPFTADPYAAMLMAGMPRSTSNVNSILANLGGGGGGGTFTPNPGTGTPVTAPVTGPVTSPTPGPGTRWGGVVNAGIPAGPISGPTWQNPTSWQGNYSNAMNVDMRNQGANVLPWASTYNGTAFGAGGAASTGDNPIMNTVRNLGNSLGTQLRGEWNGFINDISGKNGIAGVLEIVGTALGVPRSIITAFMPSSEEAAQMTPQQIAALNTKLNTQLNGLMAEAMNKGGDKAKARLEQMLTQTKANGGQLPAGWTNDTMSKADWNKTQKNFNFARLFDRRDGMTNALTGQKGTTGTGFMDAQFAKDLANHKEWIARRGFQNN
jgi:hypothetical protein